MIQIKYLKEFTFVYAILISLFHFYVNIWGGISDLWFNSAHFALLASLGFLTLEATKDENKISILNIIFAVLSISTFMYMMLFEESLYAVAHGQMRTSDVIVACLTIALAIEMVRRSTGYIIPAIIILCISYILFLGQYFEGVFAFGGMDYERFLYRMFYTSEGLFGPIATISSTYVFMFILFAAFLLKSGAGDFIVDVSNAVAGKYTGGTGHVAVFSSALMGTISGSAVANTVSTGSITIPMMKKAGFKGTFAAAVEAAASTGGQIMPPIMGAGAFIMAEFLGVPYAKIMATAIFPAILFFVTVWIGIDVFSKKYNLLAMENKDIPKLNLVIKLAPFFLIPFGILLYALIVVGKTPQYSAALAIFASILLLLVNRDWEISLKEFIDKFIEGCITASKQIASIASVIICAGIVIGVLNITGIGVKITSAILYLSNGELFVALILTAVACLILGMEVPTTAAYIICVSIAGPTLQEYGLSAIQAHLFVFWFALLSTITPPVCGTVFIASGIAQANWMEVAGKSMKLGIGLYIVPLAFVVNPFLIQPDINLTMAFLSFIKIALGLGLLSNALVNDNLKIIFRSILVLLGFVIIFFPFQ